MKKTFTTLFLSSTFATALLFAQRPGNPPDPATMVQRRVDFLTNQLALTDSQKQQATTIFTNAATAEASVHTNLKTAHDSLTAAISKNDIASIDQVSTTIGNLTAQQTSIDAKANAAFYQILTPEQQAKFAQAGERRGPFGPGPGPAGFGGRRRQQ